MQMTIPIKWKAQEADFWNVLHDPWKYVSEPDLDRLESQTIERIIGATKSKAAGYAWSGGKDSVALHYLCAKSGVTMGVCGICNLEYPAMLAWINEHRPLGVEIVNTGQGLDWLMSNQDLLFPQDANTASRWFKIIQHKAQ